MILRPLLDRSTVLVDPKARDKWDLIGGLAAALYASRGDWGLPFDHLLARVHARENQITTGLERGIALPHGLLPAGSPSRAALAILPSGLDFRSLDGQPAHFVLMLLVPDEQEGRRLHLDLLARSVRIFTDARLRACLLAAAEADSALRALAEAEARLFP